MQNVSKLTSSAEPKNETLQYTMGVELKTIQN